MASFISLCTFCEFHGPSVVIVTHSLESQQSTTRDNIKSNRGDKCYQQSVKDHCDTSLTLAERKTSRLSTKFSDQGRSSSVRAGCGYCSSLGADTQFLISHGSGQSFVSTQHGLGEIYGLAKDAAVKSISCEVVENRSGRIIFTNSPSAATVLAQTFRLPDKNARGFHRYFSIVIGTRMRGHMLRSWPTLSKGIEDILTLLETKCGPPLTQKDIMELSKSNEPMKNTYHQHESFNNLKQLTSDPSIFLRLHQKFSALLSQLATSRTEHTVIGSPVQSTLTFHEGRIELLVKILSSLSREKCGVLLHNLLSGQGLQIRSLERDSGRIVADALASVLPNNKQAEPVYFANVVLSPLLAVNDKEDDQQQVNKILSQSLIVEDSSMTSFYFLDEHCNCECTDRKQSSRDSTTCHKQTPHARLCSYCDTATSSRIVMKLLQLLYKTDLNITILHTKLLTIVEETLNQAKIWAKLKSQYEEKKCLHLFGFVEKDASILSFFKLFIR